MKQRSLCTPNDRKNYEHTMPFISFNRCTFRRLKLPSIVGYKIPYRKGFESYPKQLLSLKTKYCCISWIFLHFFITRSGIWHLWSYAPFLSKLSFVCFLLTPSVCYFEILLIDVNDGRNFETTLQTFFFFSAGSTIDVRCFIIFGSLNYDQSKDVS